MVKVTLHDTVLAESSDTIMVEGNYYFPPSSVKKDLLKPSTTSTVCPWKGTASYYSTDVGGQAIKDVAWYYPNPDEDAKNIEGYVAFYKNKVQITE